MRLIGVQWCRKANQNMVIHVMVQVLVKLPSHVGASPPVSFEWSPCGVEEMLLVAWRDGNIVVLSMSTPDRYASTRTASIHVLSTSLLLLTYTLYLLLSR